MSKKIFNAIVPPFDTIQDDLADLDTKNHSDLDQLAWSVAGHTIDTDVDFAGNDILNVGTVFVNSTIDHKIYDSGDAFYFENLNEDKDIFFRVNAAGSSYNPLQIDTSDGLVRINTDPNGGYGTSGVLNITGTLNMSFIGGGIGFNPTIEGSGNAWAGLLVSPTVNIATAVIAFLLDPSFAATVNQSVEMFRLSTPAHKAGYNDYFKFATVVDVTRQFFGGGGTADASSIDYTWLELGGNNQIGDFGGATSLPDVDERMIVLNGGTSRFLGTLGSAKQVGLTLAGFGTQGALNTLGTDYTFAIDCNGGASWMRYDYTGFDTAGSYNGLFFGAGGGLTGTPDMGIGYTGTVGTIDTSIIAASDLDIDCGTDKTVRLVETVWEDLRVPMTATKGGGVRDPGFSQFQDDGSGSTGVFTYMFSASTEEELFFSAQFSHTKKNGTDIVPHVHWSPTNTNTGTVRWGLEYTWADINGNLGNTTIIYAEDAGSGTAQDHLIAGFSAITGSGITGVSSMLICRIFRDAGHANDTYNADAAMLEFDFHFEVDTMGSRQETGK